MSKYDSEVSANQPTAKEEPMVVRVSRSESAIRENEDRISRLEQRMNDIFRRILGEDS